MVKQLVACTAGFLIISVPTVEASAAVCNTVASCLLGANLGPGVGVEGQSQRSFGVFGVSPLSHGVDGRSTSSFGVVGITSEPATSFNNARAGVLGEDGSTNHNSYNSGVSGVSPYGIGVYGTGGSYGGYFTSTNGTGLFASNEVISGNALSATALSVAAPSGMDPESADYAYTAIQAYGSATLGIAETLFRGIDCFADPDNPVTQCRDSVTIDSEGNAIFAGGITENGNPQIRTKSASGTVTSFGDRTTSPTIEDFGKATLRNGTAYVPLEPVYASTLDGSGYMVFLTPEGNSHGLYTTQITSKGFAVKENEGGRASLVFEYRIVAHPSDTKVSRLPLSRAILKREPKLESMRK